MIKKIIILLLLVVIVNFKYAFGYEGEVFTLDCRVEYQIEDKIISREIREKVKAYKNKYLSNGITDIELNFRMVTIEEIKKEIEREIKEGEIKGREKNRVIEEELKGYPKEVKLFKEGVDPYKILRINLINDRGEVEDITREWEVEYQFADNYHLIKPDRYNNRFKVYLVLKDKGYFKEKEEGKYKIEIIYNSEGESDKEIWKGEVKCSKGIEIIHPRDRIMNLLGELNWLKYYFYDYGIKRGRTHIKEIIELGEKIKEEEGGIYWCYYYLGKIYERIGEDEKAYKKYRMWVRYAEEIYNDEELWENRWEREKYKAWYIYPIKVILQYWDKREDKRK